MASSNWHSSLCLSSLSKGPRHHRTGCPLPGVWVRGAAVPSSKHIKEISSPSQVSVTVKGEKILFI